MMKRALPIGRRTLMKLAGAGALWLTYPLSQSEAQSTTKLKRFFVFCKPGGVYLPTFIQPGSDGSLEYGASVEELKPFQSKTLVVQGMTNNVAKDKHHHMRGMSTMLTGVEPRGDTGPADAKSLDQFIADRVKQPGVLGSLEVGFKPAGRVNGETRMSYDAPGAARTVEGDPAKIFSRVFSDFAAPSPEQAPTVDAKKARRQRVLDTVGRQIGMLHQELTGADRIKLDAHLETVRALEERALVAAPTGSCAVPDVPRQLSDTEEADLIMDLSAQALVCGATNVGSFMISQGAGKLKYEWLPETAPYTQGMNWHGITHQLPRNTPEAKAWYESSDRWELGLMARLLRQLDSVPEGEGTMLDHSVVLLCGEITRPDGHSHKNMTWALFGGGAAGAWQQNKWVKVDGAPLHQLHTSIGQAYGIDWDGFGKVKGALTAIST